MPPKKRQRLSSPKTASAIRQRRNQSQEYDEQRERRLSANRESIAQARQTKVLFNDCQDYRLLRQERYDLLELQNCG
jgi:hypothetical protein